MANGFESIELSVAVDNGDDLSVVIGGPHPLPAPQQAGHHVWSKDDSTLSDSHRIRAAIMESCRSSWYQLKGLRAAERLPSLK